MGQNAMWQQKVIDVVSSNMRPGPHGPLTIWDRSALMSSPESWFYKEFAGQFTKLLLRSLRFDDMNRRSRAVSNPYPKTFEWIYSDYSKDTTASFLHFLEYDQNLFWITGKPASGKSTLMKLISEDARTISHLDLWTAGEELLVSRFYFWCSGTEMQMSQEGLIRTLLCEAIQQLPGLAPIVFHDLMESFVIFGNGAVFNTHWDNSLWDMAELLEAFKRLVLEVTKSKKMFLLIDGLDEYHGDHSEQLKLVEFVYSLLSLSSNIKICVSSRPWNIFADAFHTSPSLRVEDLT
jgi:hypothetical protein